MKRLILLAPLILLLAGSIRLHYNLRRFDQQRQHDRAVLEAALDQRSRLWEERIAKLREGIAQEEASVSKRLDQIKESDRR